MQKVLVAEDDAIMREILLGKLSSSGFTALGAEDGDTALRIVQEQKPDLVLLDIMIPGKSGIEVMRAMQADAGTKDIHVIAISNSDDADSIREAKNLGVKDFLIKAIFDSSDVVEKAKQVLRATAANAKKEESTVTPQQPTSDTNNKTGMKTIFIVEDDKFLRDLAAQKLEAEGFKLTSATNGTDALEYLQNNPRPDTIVLDLILPGISGFEVLEKVKQNPDLKDVPVLILSNLGQEEDIEKAKKLGATDYLVKAHFSFAEIIKKIHAIVG